MTGVTTVVAPPVAADRRVWDVLYQVYRRHYGHGPDVRAAEAVWGWVTEDGNYRARRFYDRVGNRTLMLTYEIRLGTDSA